MNIDKFGQKVKISMIQQSEEDDFRPISVCVAIKYWSVSAWYLRPLNCKTDAWFIVEWSLKRNHLCQLKYNTNNSEYQKHLGKIIIGSNENIDTSVY